MKLLISLIACVIIFAISALNWRRSLKTVLLLLVVEGALRKWVLPQANEMIYFLKDIVLLGAYLNFYVLGQPKQKIQTKITIINILIFSAIGWCLFQIFNPSLGSPLIGFFGLRGYLVNLPLIWMVPFLFESQEELYNFLRSYLLLLIPVGIIGIVQFFSPATSMINAYSNENSVNIATFGANSSVRITGTFSYINNYSSFLIVCFGLLIPFFTIKQSRLWKLLFVSELLLLIINSFMTGSRSVILAQFLFLLCYVLIKGLRHSASIIHFVMRLLLPTLVIALTIFIWFRPAVDAFLDRTTTNKDVPNRITASLTEPIDFLKYKELDGYGTGATHQAAPVIRRALNLPVGEVIPVYFEPEMGRILLELGPIGFILWYGLRVSFLMALMAIFWKLKTPFLQQLALAAFCIQAVQISGTLVFHHTFSVYYWFLSGFIFLLPRLEQKETWKKEKLLQENAEFIYFSDSSYR